MGLGSKHDQNQNYTHWHVKNTLRSHGRFKKSSLSRNRQREEGGSCGVLNDDDTSGRRGSDGAAAAAMPGDTGRAGRKPSVKQRHPFRYFYNVVFDSYYWGWEGNRENLTIEYRPSSAIFI